MEESEKRSNFSPRLRQILRKHRATIKDKVDEGYTWENSPADAFWSTFLPVLPEKTSFRRYVEGILEDKKGSAVGIEFGGPGSKLFADFSKGFFSKTFGVTLRDTRDDKSKAEDQKRSHHVVISDILDRETYRDLEKELEGAKVDFIVERMHKGLIQNPQDAFILGNIIQRWYRLLNTPGLLMAQTPEVLNDQITDWVEMLNSKYREHIHAAFSPHVTSRSESWPYGVGVLRVIKFPDAPEELPMISPERQGR